MPELKQMLLVEPENILRRTAALTARSMGLAEVQEASSAAAARQMLAQHPFHGALISIDAGDAFDLSLLDLVRQGHSASRPRIPLAVLASRCDDTLLAALRERGINRIVLKPFRARALLDAFAALSGT
ncbi:Response regulator receiver domain-containing protein [Duganella sp. CF458]|uniref:response regulator transcription factor n=1 Tax=Duganella sp. CF458 TaxID=1884368 RepID=UPI0008E44C20|nr:response regulator transcription factor [Duganella sp. CF458]SFF77640.1 Response regulator receiver domain-containing protein [Duganella sp. CF458]